MNNCYIETKLNIYEAYDDGYITQSEKFELLYMVEYESITDDELILEKKTRDEYAREKFKKKYNFVPDKDDKYGDKGTIIANGEKVPIDLGKSKYVDGDRRVTGVRYTDKNDILLDPIFFKLKNQKRRDAVLHHELTHRNWQMPAAPDNMRVPEIEKAELNEIITRLKSKGHTDDQINKAMDLIKKHVKENLNNKPYNADNKERSNALKKLDENHTSKTNYHVNNLEKEADIGAAKATSRKDLTKALNEYIKHKRKATKKYVKSISGNLDKESKKKYLDAMKRVNISSEEDFKKRAASLKDNDLYNIDYYNKNMPRNPNK